MSDLLLDNFGWLLLIATGLLIALMCVVVKHGAQERAAFMEECLQDHKKYECTAMWRAGENHNSSHVVVVPHVR